MTHNPNDGIAAGGMLKEAAGIVEGVRQATHGPKERSFGVIAQLWMVYLAGRRGQTGCAISAFDVSVMMALLKVARAIQGTPTRDHFVDLAGYGAIAGEISLTGDEAARQKHDALAAAIIESNVDEGSGRRIRELEAEARELRALADDQARRLDLAAQMFDSYAQHHHSKSPPDGVKAQRNADMAAMCRGDAKMGLKYRPTARSAVLFPNVVLSKEPVDLGFDPAALYETNARHG